MQPRRTFALRRARRSLSAWWLRAPVLRDALLLCSSWVLLSAIVNARYPGWETRFWYLAPSLDVTVIFVSFVVLGGLGVRIPKFVLFGLACGFAFVRLFRIADGVTLRMQHRTTNVFIDGQLFPGLVRLAYTTVPTLKLVLMTLVGVLVLVLVGWASYRMLRHAARVLAEPRRAVVFSSLVAVLFVTGPYTPQSPIKEHYQGAFAASVLPRFADDFITYWSARSFSEQVERQVQAQGPLEYGPGLLAELRGSNVLLIFIESYGETLLDLEPYTVPIDRAYKAWEATLGPAGFHMASAILESPTVGGYSWLAHLTLATGIKVTDQLRYEKLYRMGPKTLVHYFVDAGYQTLLVQPATMRDPGPICYPFHKHRYSWEFGYRGRNFSWAPMPDQFVLDFIHKNEIMATEGPLFVEYNLVSGHMPWNDQAPIVPDWSTIGDGSLFRSMQGVRFDTDWSKLAHAHNAYLTAMLYDLEVLRQYIAQFVHDDTLLIILGDHQPVGEVTANSDARGAPIHVVSRNPRFIEKFVKRGYARGMRPQSSPPHPGMETFLEGFIRDFSRH